MKTINEDENYVELMEKMGVDMDQMETAMAAIFDVNKFYYLLTALLYIGSFIGVLYMWKMQKKGFHYYAIAQILILIATAVFVTSVTGASIVGPAILTALFIGIYFIYYKKVME